RIALYGLLGCIHFCVSYVFGGKRLCQWRDAYRQPDKHFNDVRFWPKADMRWISVQLDFDHCSLHRHVVLRAPLVAFGKETEMNTWISRLLLLGILSSVCGVTIASAPYSSCLMISDTGIPVRIGVVKIVACPPPTSIGWRLRA